jgi:hypothetical protein
MTHSNQRKLWLALTFLLFTSYLSSAFALPLQEPVPGTYQCFSSQTDPFDVNALSIGATLEFMTSQSYRFTTTSATEEGKVSSSLFEDTEEGINVLFQSGSVLALQPNSSSAAYEGGFFVDALGEAYIIIQNNNGFWLRCQSSGADIAASLEAARNRTTMLPEQVTTPTLNEPSERLQPLQTFQAGGYACIYTFDTTHGASGDYPSYYPDDDPTGFYVLMFANGTTLTLGQDDIFKSDYSSGIYRFDAAQNQVHLEGGSLGGLSMSYGTNAEAKTALFYSRTDYGRDDEGNQLDIEYLSTYRCEYDQPIPAELSSGYPDFTPKIDLNNITVVASNYDATINLEIEPIIDTYYCYPSFRNLEIGTGYPRYLREYVLEILPNHRYRVNGESEGEFRTGVEETYLQWLNGPFNPTGDIVEDENDYGLPHAATVGFGDWGSEITSIEIIKDDKEVHIDCFQQGAREQKALLDFTLGQPVPASYTCLPSGENPQPVALELLPNNRYRFKDQEGSYEPFTDSSSTKIVWESGPLKDETRYDVEDETGLRTLEFSFTEVHGIIPVGVSTETTMVCQAVAKANLIPKYSSTPAPPLAHSENSGQVGSGGLNGFYAKAEYENDSIENVSSSATWSYYHFLADGKVYEDGYITGDECTKTYPNGKSVCKTYSLQGNVLTFSDGESVAVSQADNGGIILDGVLYENKGLEGPQTLNGAYQYIQTSSSPIYLTVMGNGFSSSFTSSYTFSPDGRYSFSSNSNSTFSAGGNFGGAGVFGQDSSSESDVGTYTLNGNVLTLNSAAGYTKQCAFFFPVTSDTTRVNICDTDYGPLSEE